MYQNAKSSLSAETQVKAGDVTMALNNVHTDFPGRQKLCVLVLKPPLKQVVRLLVLDISNPGAKKMTIPY